ncbi:MAG: hypothetical protein KBD06_00105 [Candidatus Pacebacteria bacterium]|nr:hypothetical protein [Candidatus Paceibacterota bacterium]
MQVAKLRTDGFVTLQYPTQLRRQVEDAMVAWKRFCDLPYDEKAKLSGGDRIKDHGYMLRKDDGPKSDDKELFHLIKRNMPALLVQADTVQDRAAVRFVHAVDVLIDAVMPHVVQFARDCENEYDMPGFASDVAESGHEWTFRFLNYRPGRPIMAAEHVDRGGFTLHLYESAQGGQYFGHDGSWHEWPVDHDHTIIFPSMNLQHRSQCKLKGLCHRVVANDETIRTGRQSMVAFIDFLHTHQFNKYGGKRMQDFGPGELANMDFKQFDQLFVPWQEAA